MSSATRLNRGWPPYRTPVPAAPQTGLAWPSPCQHPQWRPSKRRPRSKRSQFDGHTRLFMSDAGRGFMRSSPFVGRRVRVRSVSGIIRHPRYGRISMEFSGSIPFRDRKTWLNSAKFVVRNSYTDEWRNQRSCRLCNVGTRRPKCVALEYYSARNSGL